MSHYQQLEQKLLGVACILAPLLLVIGAATFLLGIGVTPYGVSSWVEGIFLAFGFLLFVPVYLGLARLLGERAPRFGLICTILCVGIGFGVIPASDRITQAALDEAGHDIAVFSIFHVGVIPIVLYMFFGMLTSILLGIGFLRYGGVAKWSAILLILAPIVFVLGQGDDESIAAWQVKVMYPLATVIWFAALAPIGWRLLNNQTDGNSEI